MKGIKFGNYHSYDDFGLILSSKEIGSPEPKIIQIDVEGGDGVLDFTEFSGETKFKNRKLTFHFSKANVLDDFMTLFSEIHNSLHGKKMNIVMDEDSEFYYVGRITVNEFKADANIGKITIECDCEPWKYKKDVTREKVYLYGKNLFNPSAIEQGTFNSALGNYFEEQKSSSSTRIRSKKVIYVKSETTYTFTIPSGFDIAIRTFDKNEMLISATGWRNGTYTFTTTNQMDSIALTIRNTDDSAIIPDDISSEEFQIEEGSSSTEYEAFLQSKTVDVSIENLRRKVIPLIKASGQMNITFGGTTIAMNYSSGRYSAIEFLQGANDLTITGNGAVVFEYQEGEL